MLIENPGRKCSRRQQASNHSHSELQFQVKHCARHRSSKRRSRITHLQSITRRCTRLIRDAPSHSPPPLHQDRIFRRSRYSRLLQVKQWQRLRPIIHHTLGKLRLQLCRRDTIRRLRHNRSPRSACSIREIRSILHHQMAAMHR